jgi:hypothetical protein
VHYKAVWISDVYLGARGCAMPGLPDFLRQTDLERRCLVAGFELVL